MGIRVSRCITPENPKIIREIAIHHGTEKNNNARKQATDEENNKIPLNQSTAHLKLKIQKFGWLQR
tara:strand:+ start:2965 stop:3162 length:198 start_codon:yes stop_codon:yes gene_type:complete